MEADGDFLWSWSWSIAASPREEDWEEHGSGAEVSMAV